MLKLEVIDLYTYRKIFIIFIGVMIVCLYVFSIQPTVTVTNYTTRPLAQDYTIITTQLVMLWSIIGFGITSIVYTAKAFLKLRKTGAVQ